MPEKKKFRHRPEPLFIPPPPSYNANPAASYSGATLYQSQLRSPRVLGDHLLLDPARELPPYTPPPMLSPVRQGSGLFSNVLIAGHGPGAHPQLPLTPLTPTPRVLLCRSSESPPPPHPHGRPGSSSSSLRSTRWPRGRGHGDCVFDADPRGNRGPAGETPESELRSLWHKRTVDVCTRFLSLCRT